MSLRLTRDLLKDTYEYLRKTPPYSTLKLPPSHAVKFRVIKAPLFSADFGIEHGKPTIRVSEAMNGTLTTLLATVGHEMKHLHQWQTGDRECHGPRFQRFAKRASAILGIDYKLF